ncbi:MAG: amidophosphoribosyltransferase [Candidatus Micrarchaeia archaeon]
MEDVLRESCGVYGIISLKSGGNDEGKIAYNIYNGIFALQHRGQDGAGIATISRNENDDAKIHIKKGANFVNRVFENYDFSLLKGNLGVGSVRYPTVGQSRDTDAQPFYIENVRGGLAIAHNGNLVNYKLLRKELTEEGFNFISDGDAEIILYIVSRELKKNDNVFEAVKQVMKKLEGAYSDVVVTGKGELIAFRDPHAIRPLVWAIQSGPNSNNITSVMVASESVAFDINNDRSNSIKLKGELMPGEVLFVENNNKNELIINRKIASDSADVQRRHCMFEYVYFSRPDSIYNGEYIYDIRLRLGEELAKIMPVKADIIVPVPDTARPAAEGYSKISRIPVGEGLMKNRYISRTFIMPSQDKREDGVRMKFNTINSVINDRDIILIDDSIVRGTTLKKIINLLKENGAKKVHVRITAPPIIAPCFYGIDMANHKQLIAYRNNQDIEKIGKEIGADSLAYQSIDSLIKAINLPKSDLCLACLNSNYPTKEAQRIADEMVKVNNDKGRYYE